VLTATAGNANALLPDAAELEQEGRSVSPETLETLQTAEVGRLEWLLVSYMSSDGPCLDVVATGPSGTLGRQSGCGEPDRRFHVGIGMHQIAGRSFSIACGTAPDGADSIALNFSDGRTQVLPVEHGTWMYIEPETVSELDGRGTRRNGQPDRPDQRSTTARTGCFGARRAVAFTEN
jgi:hypothetical protein